MPKFPSKTLAPALDWILQIRAGSALLQSSQFYKRRESNATQICSNFCHHPGIFLVLFGSAM